MLGLGSDDLGSLLQHSATTGSIGAGLLGTLFSGGRIEGDIRESEAVQRQMVVKYQQAVQAALRDVEDALSFRAKAGEAARRGEEQITALQDVARLSQVRYEGGQASYYEVLDAQRQLYAAEQQQVQRRRDTYVSLVSVYAAMGGGWMVAQQQMRKTTPAGGASLPAAPAPAKPTPRQDAKP
jgi:multidrug efflux system outer membrane protein